MRKREAAAVEALEKAEAQLAKLGDPSRARRRLEKNRPGRRFRPHRRRQGRGPPLGRAEQAERGLRRGRRGTGCGT